MKFFLISDNIDTEGGMRLAGIDGMVVHTPEEVNKALDTAINDSDVGIVLMTEKLITLCHDRVYDIKLHTKKPLIVEIPDRHGTSEITKTINKYISEAIGISNF